LTFAISCFNYFIIITSGTEKIFHFRFQTIMLFKNKELMKNIGLHPFAAFAFIAVDMMLFGSDIIVVGWFISCIIGLMLIIPCTLIQKWAYHDSWSVAVSKGVILGILTAIPTPLPSFITGISGILGLIGNSRNILPEDKNKLSE
jgi:uncharacterized membrane protein YphA (DoxX/SURF4 family)